VPLHAADQFVQKRPYSCNSFALLLSKEVLLTPGWMYGDCVGLKRPGPRHRATQLTQQQSNQAPSDPAHGQVHSVRISEWLHSCSIAKRRRLSTAVQSKLAVGLDTQLSTGHRLASDVSTRTTGLQNNVRTAALPSQSEGIALKLLIAFQMPRDHEDLVFASGRCRRCCHCCTIA
jgi:hypothetical protein